MNLILLLALSLANLAFGNPESINYNAITNFEGEPSIFVHNVDVTTGNYCESVIDLAVPGAEPLYVQRFYSSANTHQSIISENGVCGAVWFTNYGGQLAPFPSNDDHVKKVYLKEPNGNVCHFQGKVDYSLNCYKMHIDPVSYKHGHTNCGKGFIGGRSNIKNIRTFYNTPTEEMDMRVHAKVVYGSGKVREFLDNQETKNLLTNGNSIAFEYDEKKKLKKVKALNSSGKRIASLNYPAPEFNFKKNVEWEITSSDNRSVKYRLKRSDNGYWLEEVISSDTPKVKYRWDTWSYGGVITKVEYPNDRFTQIEYVTPHGTQVRKIYQPVGTDERPVVTYRFEYDEEVKDRRKIDVKDAESNLTKYECHLGRVQSITRFQGLNDILNVEKCYWGEVDTPEYTNLVTRTIENAKGNICICRHMKYDNAGNVTKEILYGNLTGKNPEKFATVDEKGKPKSNGTDLYVKDFVYSEDGFNLLLSEKDNRSMITYTYYPKRDLVKSKFVWNKNQIAIRYFYEYDNNGVLVCEIKDNGISEDIQDLSGVTERQIKRIKVRTEQAPIGADDEIELRYLDLATGYERLLHRTINDYTLQGRLKEQHHYDSENGYLYSLYWEYDSKGHVIRETDPLGYVTERKYDANGNMIYEQGPRGDTHREFKYDYSNRLIAKEEVMSDGTRIGEHYRYNYLSQKVGVTDIYGNETLCTYDALGRMTSTTLAPTISETGAVVQTILKTTYDALGYPLAKTDGRGAITETLHTVRGKPYFIRYPDGTCDRNEYSTDGMLIKNVNSLGVSTHYSYDYQGRVVKEECYSENGELLTKRSNLYNAFHLIAEIDANGNQTSYHYDGAGRLVRTQIGNRFVDIEYDTSSRILRTSTYDVSKADEGVVLHYKYDVLNRPIEETTEDFKGNVQTKVEYIYDEVGNRTQTITYGEQGKAITQSVYNPLGQVVKIIDPEGQITAIRYDYSYINELGHHVPFKEVTDPLGNTTQEIHDTLGRIAQVVRKNKFGKITQKYAIKYDKNNNKRVVDHTVVGLNVPERSVVTTWNYDNFNRVTSVTDAAGTAEQKQTQFKYNDRGQKETVIKPDGTKMIHQYDALGRLHDLNSSDKTIHYVYSYDSKGNCTRVEDLVHQKETTRKYDMHDLVVEEQLNNGLALKFEYDGIGRNTQIVLPDQTTVKYDYEGVLLKEISRFDAEGVKQYQHTYGEYDLSGRVLSMQCVGAVGQVDFKYDLIGRVKAIKHPSWSEEVSEYDKAGNLLKAKTKDLVGAINHQFSYDDLYQIKSEKGVSQHTYGHDSIYNRLEKDNHKSKINQLNQLVSDELNKYVYDLNGNLIEMQAPDGVTKFGYDALDRITSVKKENKIIEYTYDAFNRRLTKTVNGVTTRFLYMGENECGAVTAKGTIKELRILGNGKGAEIGAAVAIELKKVVYVPIHNHAGNVMALVKADDGVVAETYRYTAFGEETIFDGAGTKQSISLNPWRFSSKRVDRETGFVFFGRRCYDPCAGRWITRDPKGYEAGPNLYAYVMNNPLVRFDLYGLEWVQDGDTWVRRTGEHDLPSNMHCRSSREREDSQRMAMSRMESRGGDYYRAKNYSVGGNPRPNYVKTVGNGITTPRKTIIQRAQDASETLDGMQVDAFHVQSHGFWMDVIHNTLMRMGFCTPAVHEMVNKIRRDIKNGYAAGVTNPILDYDVHSNGGRVFITAVSHLTIEERMMIHVDTYGTAAIVPNGLVGEATNFIAKYDYVPICGDTLGFIKANLDPGYADVRYIEPNTSPFSRHSFETNYCEIQRENNKERLHKLNGGL